MRVNSGKHGRLRHRSCIDSPRRAVVESLEQRRLLALTVPVFNSLPGAFRKIFLDFDGNPAFTWNNADGKGDYAVHGPGSTSAPVPGYNIDGDPNNFSAAETSEIQQIWAWVSEKYSPFNVNVTTVDPGNRNNGETAQCIIGGSNADWYGNGGGVAAIGGFMSGLPNTCFVWSGDSFGSTSSRRVQFVADSAAHECGHELSLVHERTPTSPGQPPAEYYAGDSTRTPIMGGASNNTTGARAIWWKTNNWAGQNSPDATQDELASLTSIDGGLVYSSDDHPIGTFGSLTLDNNGQFVQTNGIIENTADDDRFTFTATNPHVIINVDNAANGSGMLAPSARLLFGTSNSVVASSTNTNTRATLDVNSLTLGQQYSVQVLSQGGYGDIGQYRITGSMQQFATYSSTTRTVYITGVTGDNHVSVFRFDTNTLEVSDSFGAGGSTFQTYSLSGVDHVVVTLGSGNDDVTVRPIYQPGSLTPIDTYIDGGGGTNTAIVDQTGDNLTTFNMNGDGRALTWTVLGRPGTYAMGYYNVQQVDVHGTNDSDTVNLNSLPFGTKFFAYGSGGSNVMNVGLSILLNDGAQSGFFGGPLSDVLNIDASSLPTALTCNIIPTSSLDNTTSFTMVPHAVQREVKFDAAVERVAITGTPLNDSLGVEWLPNAANTVALIGNGGDDNVDIGVVDSGRGDGLPFSDYIKGAVSVQGGAGTDTITIEDNGAAGAHTYTVNDTSLHSDTSGLISYGRTDTEQVTIVGVDAHPGVYNVGPVGSLGTPPLALQGGSQTDTFNLTNVGVANLSVDGGGGTNSLSVNDQGRLTSTTYDIYDNRIRAQDLSNNIATYNYTHLTSATINDSANGALLRVNSTAPSTSYNLNGNNGVDNFVMNDDPNSIDTVICNGGAGTSDSFTLSGSAFNLGSTYNILAGQMSRVHNGASGAYSFSGVETTSLLTTGGDDTINFVSYFAVPLSVNAGVGNDTFTFSGDGSPALQPFATIDGGPGSDSFTMNDQTTAGIIRYTLAAGSLVRTNLSNGVTYSLNLTGFESQTVNAGNQTDFFNVNGVSPGVRTILNGGGAIDTLSMGPATSTLEGIQGPVVFDGQAAGGTVAADDSADTTGDLFRLSATTLGAFSGDNLFGPGGSLTFANLVNNGGSPGINLVLGSGADTIYAQPLASARVSISAGNPATSPGDAINLALAAAQNPVVTGTSTGNITSSNLQTLNWTGIEQPISTDAVAPAVVNANINLNGVNLPGKAIGRWQAVDVTFSENIGLITPTSLQLMNTTTGQSVPAANVAVTYDLATLTAHFTFPGYSNFVLPDGNYHGVVVAGQSNDTFGNALASSILFDFFVLAGDANHDRRVDVTDLGVLATNWQGNGKLFSEGDFNYDGIVNVTDLGILATNWQKSLPAAAPSTSKVSVRLRNAPLIDEVSTL